MPKPAPSRIAEIRMPTEVPVGEKMKNSRPRNVPNHAPEMRPGAARAAPRELAGDALDRRQVGADDRELLHGELGLGERVDSRLRLGVGLEGRNGLTLRQGGVCAAHAATERRLVGHLAILPRVRHRTPRSGGVGARGV